VSPGRLDTIFFLILAMVVAGIIGAIAFALIGAGMPAFARRPGHTAVIALTMLATAWSYATGSGNLPELMLIAGGAGLLPVRLIWAVRTGGIKHPSANAL
jgi:hypothetical protein